MNPPISPRIPLSTYRVQFNRAFTFLDAVAIIPYLHALGISDLYASSYLKAVPGSMHGYDLTDPTQLNPEIGTEKDYQMFLDTLSAHGMGHLLDMIPNHMGIARSSNPWWLDVLENGPSSAYAFFFDIDWHPIKAELEDKVLLPILGDLYGLVLENQEITVLYEDDSFWVHYGDNRLPVAPTSYGRILTHRLEYVIQQVGAGHPAVQELQSVVTAAEHLPARSERDPVRMAERNREKEIMKRRLAVLVKENPAIQQFLDENLRLFNGIKGDPATFDLLDDLLNDQAYRLAYWRVAAEEINYRRFFDINDLVAIHMENPLVFEATHRLIFQLVQRGYVTGLRVDHVDGLYDPGGYLCQLQASMKDRTDDRDAERPLFLIVEKILGAGESLPPDWPVHGTTGYDFLNVVNGLFVDGSNVSAFDEIYTRFTGLRLPYDELIYEKKKLIMGLSMASEINVLGHQLNRLSEKDRRSRDFTLYSLIHAIREIIACFPVYRSYMTAGSREVTDRDRAYIRLAALKAKRRHPALSRLVFDFIRDLLLQSALDPSGEAEQERVRFMMKFQQTTSPITAKGIEDTAFYIYNRLVSLNEVGGDPEQFGMAVSSFHGVMRERHASWPHSLSATSTHDTKRSEDVRARINVLSEMPGAWRSRVRLWSRLNKKYRALLDGQPAPDRNEEYLLYQTLIGTWPLEALDDGAYRVFCDRIEAYMDKALHEAKLHTSWLNPNHHYMGAVRKFIQSILDRTRPNPFLQDMATLIQDVIVPVGLSNALAQTLIKIMAPGIPDFYQGTELWDFSLVDPDNRRPVDYARRMQMITELQEACRQAGNDRRVLARQLRETCEDGRIKLYVIMTGLNFRRAQASLFLHGTYLPLDCQGDNKDLLCAFARLHDRRAVIIVVPRLTVALGTDRGPDVWRNTAIVLPPELSAPSYRNVFTGEMLTPAVIAEGRSLCLADVFQDFPLGLLESIQ